MPIQTLWSKPSWEDVALVLWIRYNNHLYWRSLLRSVPSSRLDRVDLKGIPNASLATLCPIACGDVKCRGRSNASGELYIATCHRKHPTFYNCKYSRWLAFTVSQVHKQVLQQMMCYSDLTWSSDSQPMHSACEAMAGRKQLECSSITKCFQCTKLVIFETIIAAAFCSKCLP